MKIGDKIKRKIEYGAEYGGNLPPEEGIVVYIHPERRFFTLEFTFERNGELRKFRESYPLRNKITQAVVEYDFRYKGPRLPGHVTQKKGKYLKHI